MNTVTHSPQWTFDRAKFFREYQPEDNALIRGMTEAPAVEVMSYVGRFVADGPIDVDWADRYGWTVLSTKELILIRNAFLDAIENWLAHEAST